MKTNLLRHLAVVIGLGSCAIAQAQTSVYQAPTKWSTFNGTRSTVTFRTVASPRFDDAPQAVDKADRQVKQLPIPAFIPGERPLVVDGKLVPPPTPQPMPSAAGCAPCQSPQRGSRAMRTTTRPISPWFAGADLLFLSVANDSGRSLVVSDAASVPYLNSSQVDAHSATGFDAHFGRYFGCGRWGLDVGYFLFNPAEESVIAAPGVAGDWQAAMPASRDVSVDPGGGIDTVWNHFDGAAAYRARRDLFVQGIEANWVGFGLMGARRLGTCGPAGPLSRVAPRFGRYGYFGGACSAMARACSGRVQIQTMQGFRWFQLEDAFEFAGDINGAAGYQADDLYYNVDTENNLFGYQVGSRVTYCLGPRLNVGIGGKIGLYGNRATYRQRIGTEANLGYLTASGLDDVLTENSDTVVSALGELDLGLGFRLNNAWTVRGGYRLLSASGVATATDSIADGYTSLASSGRVSADDCIILHGGYVGLEFNW